MRLIFWGHAPRPPGSASRIIWSTVLFCEAKKKFTLCFCLWEKKDAIRLVVPPHTDAFSFLEKRSSVFKCCGYGMRGRPLFASFSGKRRIPHFDIAGKFVVFRLIMNYHLQRTSHKHRARRTRPMLLPEQSLHCSW
jgi:hypothetical protein